MSVTEVPTALDLDGVAVITGGGSGFGLNVATRLVSEGMRVALLDVSRTALKAAETSLTTAGASRDKLLVVACDVSNYDDCVRAQRACAAHFGSRRISFLFNNAGIIAPSTGGEHNYILEGPHDAWPKVFAVNVFGAVHIIKAFLPRMIEQGPLPSGKPTFVVTTSSVVGLLNHMPGPYSASKMAVTAICEQLTIELDDLGARAAHITSRSLHPTIASTNLLGDMRAELEQSGSADADYIVSGLFRGMDSGTHYIVVDHHSDIPTELQIARRAEDQRTGRRPHRPEPLGSILAVVDPDKYSQRLEANARRASKL